MREMLGTSGLKEGAAGPVGEQSLWEVSQEEEGETDHRRHKHSPWKKIEMAVGL
jgi:hypothetical protein